MEASRLEGKLLHLKHRWKASRSKSPLPRASKTGSSPKGSNSHRRPRELWDDALDEAAKVAGPVDFEEEIYRLREVDEEHEDRFEDALTSGTSPHLQLCDQILRLAKQQEAKSREEAWHIPGTNDVEVRTFLGQIGESVQKFIGVGDVLAQIDPIHVGVPWAGIRMLLQVSLIFHSLRALISPCRPTRS